MFPHEKQQLGIICSLRLVENILHRVSQNDLPVAPILIKFVHTIDDLADSHLRGQLGKSWVFDFRSERLSRFMIPWLRPSTKPTTYTSLASCVFEPEVPIEVTLRACRRAEAEQ